MFIFESIVEISVFACTLEMIHIYTKMMGDLIRGPNINVLKCGTFGGAHEFTLFMKMLCCRIRFTLRRSCRACFGRWRKDLKQPIGLILQINLYTVAILQIGFKNLSHSIVVLQLQVQLCGRMGRTTPWELQLKHLILLLGTHGVNPLHILAMGREYSRNKQEKRRRRMGKLPKNMHFVCWDKLRSCFRGSFGFRVEKKNRMYIFFSFCLCVPRTTSWSKDFFCSDVNWNKLIDFVIDKTDVEHHC